MAQRLTKTLLCHSRSGKEPGRVARAAYESMLQDSSKTAAGCEFITLESARQGLLERNLTVKELLVGKDIAIVGAGVAGLNAALKLQGALSREGLDKKYQNNVRIFEASSETGGRLFTHKFGNSGAYCDIGGMRLPPHHAKVHELIEQLDLKKKKVAYVLDNPDTRFHFNGKTHTKQKAKELMSNDPKELGFEWVKGSLPPAQLGQGSGPPFKTPDQLYSEVLDQYVQQLKKAQEEGGDARFRQVFLELALGTQQPQIAAASDSSNSSSSSSSSIALDDVSLRQLMQMKPEQGGKGWKAELVAYLEATLDQTGAFDVSFMEQLVDAYEFDGDGTKWTTLKGGLQTITDAMTQLLQDKYKDTCTIEYNTRVIEVSETNANGKVSLWGIETTNDRRRGQQQQAGGVSGGAESDRIHLGDFDKVLLAVPPVALRMMRTPGSWDPLWREAIRAMRFDPIRKIGLHFKTRWWENEKYCNPAIHGGQSVTDLPSRWIVYPSQPQETQGVPEEEGALLCYCWTSDAYSHLTLSPEDKVRQALDDLTVVHGPVVREQYIEGSAFAWEWSLSYAGGIAFFAPGQWRRYYSIMQKNQGPVYFAGEHLSVHHAWIEGALETSDLAVAEMVKQHADAQPAPAIIPHGLAPAHMKEIDESRENAKKVIEALLAG